MSDAYQMTVSLDFPTNRMSGWSAFNTWLRKALDPRIDLKLYREFDEQRRAIIADEVDIIYASPFDASRLVREKGFVPVVRPAGKRYECIVAVPHGDPSRVIEDLQPGCRVVSTDHPDVNMIGMIMLEPADLDLGNVHMVHVDGYPQLAEALLRGDADVGLFLEEVFDELAEPVRALLRPLAQSRINDISHVFLLGPRLRERCEDARRLLLGMADEPDGVDALTELGFTAWETMGQEDTELMIDLMDALKA
ncbi:MAG: PhnD/SsuA/transferrin family substrate-binding protein [Gallionellaceae bacterium]|nr:PhnD/SsuA/transferrin family substrate-binding protein [Gallionellaceae bacterium]